ncbi:hypothetical protein [Sedimentisphaera salicampi]|uniref:hypothetical protein n=1 Tax=Sedimentisphaera salicampi TaxID=1941349 RepID=UPI000B9A6D33|nr:hypothetical protein [Sedimentisphaera salicampi]OXU15118.1 hypothetical protein SMSP1_01048 [Sedimentisphaera salicampi]
MRVSFNFFKTFFKGKIIKRIILAAVVYSAILFDFGVGVCYASQLPAVPKANIDFDQNVSEWWQQHPFNPESPNFNPDIDSPAHTVNLNPVESISDAIRYLPQTGGTIVLAAGSYVFGFDIIGKINIILPLISHWGCNPLSGLRYI